MERYKVWTGFKTNKFFGAEEKDVWIGEIFHKKSLSESLDPFHDHNIFFNSFNGFSTQRQDFPSIALYFSSFLSSLILADHRLDMKELFPSLFIIRIKPSLLFVEPKTKGKKDGQWIIISFPLQTIFIPLSSKHTIFNQCPLLFLFLESNPSVQDVKKSLCSSLPLNFPWNNNYRTM